jgi:hypothetical protein
MSIISLDMSLSVDISGSTRNWTRISDKGQCRAWHVLTSCWRWGWGQLAVCTQQWIGKPFIMLWWELRPHSHFCWYEFDFRNARLSIHKTSQHLVTSRIWRVLTMVCNTQNHWVCGLYPSSGILNFRNWICFRLQMRGRRHLLCWVP